MSDDKYLVFKIAVGVVLGLLVWNGIEQYQRRKAVEEAMLEIQRIAADPDPLGWRAAAARQKANKVTAQSFKAVPPGFRCEQGVLLKRVNEGWTQVTSRSNEWYCPHGGTVDDCYRVSVETVGCR